MKVRLLIPAAGMGTRLGSAGPKALVDLCGEPMLARTLARFFFVSPAPPVIVTAPPGHVGEFEAALSGAASKLECMVTPGGLERQESVAGALALLDNDDDLVVIHDAARPFVSTALISRCFEAAKIHDCGVIPVVEETNSVRQLTGSGSCMLDRKQLRLVQTPQVFPAAKIKRAYTTSFDPAFTDDASVVEREGCPILLVEGEENNFKIKRQSFVRLPF